MTFPKTANSLNDFFREIRSSLGNGILKKKCIEHQTKKTVVIAVTLIQDLFFKKRKKIIILPVEVPVCFLDLGNITK